MKENNTTGSVGGGVNSRIKYLIEAILKITPYEFSKELGKVRPDWLYKIIKNEVEPSPKTLNLIFDKYPEYKLWLVTGDTTALHSIDKKSQALKALNTIKDKKKLGKKSSEGRLIDESELVPVEQFIIPIPGQAGLKKAFFAPDQYIEDHFEKEIIYVKPSERTTYHKIEVDGNSMPGVLEPGEWARCEDIPQMYWENKDTFKPNKVYCLFHRKHGILFKRVSIPYYGSITLSSDNPDKVEYPDETFDLMEFSKILIVRKKEVDL